MQRYASSEMEHPRGVQAVISKSLWLSSITLASQMSSYFLISPYESELSTAFLKNNRPLSYLNWSSYKERRVDALALRADERRDKLR